MDLTSLPRISAIALLLAGVLATPAAAATRYAAPAGTATSGCTQSAPCRIDSAINSAAGGDEVVVTQGDYAVATSLSPAAAVKIRGAAGVPRPRLLGATPLTAPVVSLRAAGSSIAHLYISAGGTGAALELQGASGDDLVLVGQGGDAASIMGSSAGTLLRDALVRATGPGDAIAVSDGSPAGAADVRNVTAIADGTGRAVYSQMRSQNPTLRNVITRGTQADITGNGSIRVDVAHSNFRPSATRNIVDSGANQSGDPLFANAGGGDFHLLPGSPAIDAGAVDSLVGAVDADGFARVIGSAPDIGAFEYGSTGSLGTGDGGTAGAGGLSGATGSSATGAGAAADLTTPILPGSPPKAGRTVNVVAASGKVTFRLAGQKAVALDQATAIPVGATVDATHGTVRLASARTAGGAAQNAVLSGGAFEIRQDQSTALATAFVLRGGDFGSCKAASTAKLAFRSPVAAGKTPGKRVVRQLWARDKGGRFRTDGRYASALVRGTVWLTQDRCDGTLVRVAQGQVVVHDRTRRKDVVVKAGRTYLARSAR